MKNKIEKKWFSSGFGASKPQRVDREKGILYGVSVTTEGEAKGHGVFLDADFVADTVRLGNAKKQGLKARFGHPNMCSEALGTFIGRFKNFRADGIQARADLFLSNEAKETPNGNLYEYILGMAEKEFDMLGTSIVFTNDGFYRKDKSGNKYYRHERENEEDRCWEVYYTDENGKETDINISALSNELFIKIKDLHACDAVDEPAANEGLFSKFGQETVAGQMTEFLDLHPQIWQAVSGNEEILSAISKYGDKISEFFQRYQEYRAKHNQGVSKMEKEEKAVVQMDADQKPVVAAPETVSAVPEPQKLESPAAESAKPAEVAPVAEAAKPEAPKPAEPVAKEAKPVETEKTFSVKLFSEIEEKYGVEIASKVVKAGKGVDEAVKMFAETLKIENGKLKEKLAKLSTAPAEGAAPVPFSDGEVKPKKTIKDLFKKSNKES